MHCQRSAFVLIIAKLILKALPSYRKTQNYIFRNKIVSFLMKKGQKLCICIKSSTFAVIFVAFL